MDLTYTHIARDWQTILGDFFKSQTGLNLLHFLQERNDAGATIYPPKPFYALELTERKNIRVVIVGQDPYHGPNQAQGLAFHVGQGVRIPPSLRNIHKELARDLGINTPTNGNLIGWARQGVLLLNAVLTVEDGKPACHAKKGWEALTDKILETVAADPNPKVFLLWGAFAQSKKALIESQRQSHAIFTANHPSPLSAMRPPEPFIGCGHFSKTNAWLTAHRQQEIHWENFGDNEKDQLSFSF